MMKRTYSEIMLVDIGIYQFVETHRDGSQTTIAFSGDHAERRARDYRAYMTRQH